MLLKSQHVLSKNDVSNIATITVLCQKAEKCFGDARINALQLRLGDYLPPMTSNLQNHFAHLPAQERPKILTKLRAQCLSFRAHQIYTNLD